MNKKEIEKVMLTVWNFTMKLVTVSDGLKQPVRNQVSFFLTNYKMFAPFSFFLLNFVSKLRCNNKVNDG